MKCFVFLTFFLLKLGNSSPTCPDAADILPCTCTYNANVGTDIICNGDILESQIETAFEAFFPLKDLDEFHLKNNRYIRELTLPVFNDITFTSINIYHTEIVKINDTFFDGQQNTLVHLYMFDNRLGNSGFPYEVLPNLTNLVFLNMTSNHISELPSSIPPNNLQFLQYQDNTIDVIEDGTFGNCQSLTELHLSSNSIKEIVPGNCNSNLIYWE